MAESLAYPSGVKGGNLLLQMILPALPRVEGGGGLGSAPCGGGSQPILEIL
jgi:hypothetical protein